MITHLIKSINWIDACVIVLFLRMVFVGVKNGFLSEFFKTLGVVVAIFVSLHYYSFLAAWIAKKTNSPWGYWELLVCGLLWLLIALLFRLVRMGTLLLFKAETTHEGFDKYAAGVVAVGRAILVCSLSMFLVLLAQYGPLERMTVRSYSFKIAGHAAVNTYSFLYKNLVDKFCAGEHFNKAALEVLHPDGK